MALRKMVENDCGSSNSLVNFSSHFVQDRALKDDTFHDFNEHLASSSSDQLVQEFLEETMGHSTQPFRMDSLLVEMRDLESRMGPVRSPTISELTREEDVQAWAQQYIDAGKHFDESVAEPGIWTMSNNPKTSSDDYLDLGLGPKWATDYLQKSQDTTLEEPTLGDLSNSEEYVDSNAELREVAGEILKNTAGDSKLSDSKQINNGDVSLDPLDEEEVEEASNRMAEHWSLEHNQDESKWAAEFNEPKPNIPQVDEFHDKMWKNFTEQWEKLSSKNTDWMSEYEDFSGNYLVNSEYEFSTENPMDTLGNPLEEGQRKLAEGDLPSAVLCFEAAVNKEQDNALAWQLLGTTQAENEQDPQAIKALKRCLQIEPSNLDALMALAVSYTNENYQNQACNVLKEWLKVNPKYSDLVPTSDPSISSGISSIMTKENYDETKSLLLKAANRGQRIIDPEVQCALGVLFNLSSELEMAVDCFKAALTATPTNSALWNRLGATLANSSRSEEAVDAYRSALQLRPGFIRARYNLGIACIHLSAYKEAVEHLLTCLNQQASGRGPQGLNLIQMSDSIWGTLRLTIVSHLDRQDLLEPVIERDLKKLNMEFGID